MRKRLFVSVLVAALMSVWGGRVSAQVNPDHAALLAQAEAIVRNVPRIIAAEQAAYEAGMANQRHQQRQSPLPVLPVPPVTRQQPVAKPPVVASPAAKPQKVVEQTKLQTAVKPPQSPMASAASGLKVFASKMPPLPEDTVVNGASYEKGVELYFVWRKSPDGKIVDKNGGPTTRPDIERNPPVGTTLVSAGSFLVR